MKRGWPLKAWGWALLLLLGLGWLWVESPYAAKGGSSTAPEEARGMANVPATPTWPAEANPGSAGVPGADAIPADVGFAVAWREALGFLGKFGILLVLLVASLRMLKILALRQQALGDATAQIRIVDVKALSSKRTLYLVEVQSRMLLIFI